MQLHDTVELSHHYKSSTIGRGRLFLIRQNNEQAPDSIPNRPMKLAPFGVGFGDPSSLEAEAGGGFLTDLEAC